MPMGEVYPALAKGVLDGVVAPKDTLKSLHFAEVAHYFNTLDIPRGAYAARAMGARRWRSLSGQQRAILEEGVAVWERALESELRAAETAGDAAGREQGVVYTAPPPADVARFLDIYDRQAALGARQLQRFGIDGLAPYRLARRVVADTHGHDSIHCPGEAP
jgi:TRAP-type C4-dicarboxylate transport system substrate-binding protein